LSCLSKKHGFCGGYFSAHTASSNAYMQGRLGLAVQKASLSPQVNHITQLQFKLMTKRYKEYLRVSQSFATATVAAEKGE
jgi:dihydroxyacid dehydratase/phosphogluconate dehydratase